MSMVGFLPRNDCPEKIVVLYAYLLDYAMKKVIGPIRRASIYGLVSYLGLVLINNSNLELPSMWIAYLPMFLSVYALTQWIDRRFG
tara:strand:+ start:1030 stop:1287 length:258 start_codon:yes stop_codon:yes gene_type:complete